MSSNISTFYKRSVATINKRTSSKAIKGLLLLLKDLVVIVPVLLPGVQKYIGFCDDFVLLTKTEGNVIVSGHRNARGYGYVSLFNLRF